MAASRRGQPALSVHLPPQPQSTAVLPDLPPISALFLIDFDVKAGYTIAWKKAVPGLELEGVVEYKSLPSGLHSVTEDLIYFVHDDGHAGLSAFVNARTDEEETRHARMIAVGVLVPLSYGRLGRAWRHAEALKEMASMLAIDGTQTDILDQYWDANGARDTSAPQPLRDTVLDSPAINFRESRPGPGKGHNRNRSVSDGTALIPPGHRLSAYHPAWSLTSLLDTFGPLIFPIHRAALLRKRILISTYAPVHEACDFVYDISVLSNIPQSVFDIVEPSASVQRLRPLFNIGVHDITYLLEHQAATKASSRGDTDDESAAIAEDAGPGWVACTTDSILAIKEGLWDMLITLPPNYSSNAKERVWPTVECPKGVPAKATQRDLRRFRSLRKGLERIAPVAAPAAPTQPSSQPENHSPQSEATETSSPQTSAIRLSQQSLSRPGTSGEDASGARRSPVAAVDEDADKIIEPSTWAALAYNGFMWWASAGEQRRSDEVDESTHDMGLLADLAPSPITMPQRKSSFSRPEGGPLLDSISSLTARRSGAIGEEDEQARIELAIIAYFHRLTTSILSVLANIVDSSDDDDILDVDFEAAAASLGGAESNTEDATARLLPGGGVDMSGTIQEDEDDLYAGSGWIRVDSDALAQMGLDVWSQSDADFVREVTARYFGRKAYVELKGVEVCGLRVC
ncbi:LCHN [Rhypophila sp. PSN 637]